MRQYLKNAFVVVVAVAGIAYGLHLIKTQQPVDTTTTASAVFTQLPTHSETMQQKNEVLSTVTIAPAAASSSKSTAPAHIDLRLIPVKAVKTSQVQTCVWPHTCAKNA